MTEKEEVGRKEEAAFVDGKRIGFTSNGRLYLQRCPKCENENWAPAVSAGQCAWCGWKPEETYEDRT